MLSPDSKDFLPYGYLLKSDTSALVEYLNKKTGLPAEGNIYVRNDENLIKLKEVASIKEEAYADADIEAGYCNGFNSKLNCLEAHTCPEVDIPATDLVLLLALPSDIENGQIDSRKVKAFYLKKGQSVVLYPYVLHFSPCKVSPSGFKCGIILTAHTNEDLKEKPKDPRIWKVNKWLYAHKDSKQASLGAYIGIKGENIEVPC
jgi:hypothetical protein